MKTLEWRKNIHTVRAREKSKINKNNNIQKQNCSKTYIHTEENNNYNNNQEQQQQQQNKMFIMYCYANVDRL